jgi:hypothetical protein
MDKETIQQIAAEVVAQLPLGDRYWMYMYLVINVAVVAVAAALAAWFGSFLKTKGQNFATKQDFDELLRQLRTNTDAVETIKSEIGQRDWVRREWTNLRRVKLEALLEKMHECEEYLDRRRDLAVEGKGGTPERKSINELDVLAALYFPELKNEVDLFVSICRNQRLLIIKYARAVLKAGGDIPARDAAYEDYESKWKPHELSLARDTLTTAARSLLERVMNVDDGTPQSDER